MATAVKMPTKAELKRVLKKSETYEEAADYFDVHVETLRKWRKKTRLN